MREHGCRVSIVAGVSLNPSSDAFESSKGKSWLVDREEHNGVQIFRAKGTRFPKKRFIGRATNYITYFLSACCAGLRLGHPDVVVSLTDPPIIGLAAWMTSLRYHAPFVMSYRDIFPEVARLLEEFQSESINWILQRVNRFLVRRATRIVALGETMRQKLIQGKGADPEKITIIPDWADCEQIVPASKDNPFTRQNGLLNKFVVMHSGNLGLSQALESVVDSAAHLQEHPDIAMVFVGEGVKKPELQEKAKALGLKNASFLPYQPKERLIESFAAADVFVVSLKVGMSGYIVPSKLYGILAAGRPYIAAVEELSEAVEIAQKHHCGLPAKTADPKDLAIKILMLYNDREMARQMGENARRVAEDFFDLKPNVQAYFELFRDLTEGPVGSACSGKLNHRGTEARS